MNLRSRSYKKELLDADDIPFDDIKRNMKELDFINTYLGGHKISIDGLKELAGKKKALTVCEIGCGGGDNIKALKSWCNRRSIHSKFIGIDIKAECIDFAKSEMGDGDDVEWIVNDYERVTFTNKPDVLFSSLFCHHFTNEQLIKQIKWMEENCNVGFFINDLHRNALAYHSIKFFTAVASESYLVKNDAPLSVARGFKVDEWTSIFEKAGVCNYKIEWKWAFRYLIIYKHERNI
jgi:2-polyprenyl-3-methyl-5-hydroxy-6-metoxy-1,4-benzoquinol methylase